MIFGYARVSTEHQSLDRQLDKLKAHGIHKANIYKEKYTGTKKELPELIRLLDNIEKGDIIVITELSRLGRSSKNLFEIAEQLEDRGVELVSLKENIDTTTATGRAMFGMLSVMAQFERDLIAERTKEGLKAARRRGRKGGRPSIKSSRIQTAMNLHAAGQMEVKEILLMTGISKSTLYKYLKKNK